MFTISWSDEEREIVRRDYAYTNASAQAIADRLDRTLAAVKGQVQRMGIAKRTDRRHWTPEEDEQLAELMPRYAPGKVAKLMRRGLNSVVVRSKRLGICRRVRDGWFTKKEVCEILGVDHKWVQKRIDGGQLRATWHNGRKPTNCGSAMWHIEEKDLREFIRRYPQDLNARNLDLIVVVDILAGIAN